MDRYWPPFFGALHALAIDDAGGGTGFSLRSLSALDVERMMNTIEHAVALPPNEVVVDRAARWKILRKVTPLAAGTEDIHHPVHGRAHVGSPLTAAWLGWRNERFDKRPLVIRQVAWVSQVITIVFRAVLMRPHRGPPSNQAASLESQTIQGIQQVLGRTLSDDAPAPDASVLVPSWSFSLL